VDLHCAKISPASSSATAQANKQDIPIPQGSLFSSSISIARRWASKAAATKTKNGRDSNPKYLGLKVGCGQIVVPGNILIRQRGTKFHAGLGVGIGKDHTLMAKSSGYVTFRRERIPRGRHIRGPFKHWKVRKYIDIVENNPNPPRREDIR